MNVRDTLKLLNRQRADIWWQWIQCDRWPGDTEHSHRRSALAFPRWEAEYNSGRSLISHTPSQWLCLSLIWWLKECGMDFHLAVVFRNTQRPQAAVESAACHCAEGSGAHVFHQLPCLRSREPTRLLAGQSSAFSVGGEHTAGSTCQREARLFVVLLVTLIPSGEDLKKFSHRWSSCGKCLTPRVQRKTCEN